MHGDHAGKTHPRDVTREERRKLAHSFLVTGVGAVSMSGLLRAHQATDSCFNIPRPTYSAIWRIGNAIKSTSTSDDPSRLRRGVLYDNWMVSQGGISAEDRGQCRSFGKIVRNRLLNCPFFLMIVCIYQGVLTRRITGTGSERYWH